jgi:hypothetical protein
MKDLDTLVANPANCSGEEAELVDPPDEVKSVRRRLVGQVGTFGHACTPELAKTGKEALSLLLRFILRVLDASELKELDVG